MFDYIQLCSADYTNDVFMLCCVCGVWDVNGSKSGVSSSAYRPLELVLWPCMLV